MTDEDLCRFGWAHGGYMQPCTTCKEQHIASKRSFHCRPCAERAAFEYDLPENIVARKSESIGTCTEAIIEAFSDYAEDDVVMISALGAALGCYARTTKNPAGMLVAVAHVATALIKGELD
jgi:hypothetical protein